MPTPELFCRNAALSSKLMNAEKAYETIGYLPIPQKAKHPDIKINGKMHAPVISSKICYLSNLNLQAISIAKAVTEAHRHLSVQQKIPCQKK